MWEDYSKSYIKNNRASGISIMAAAFIATMFLSLLCSLAYNFWVYEIEKIALEEGDWQGRIVCENFYDTDLYMLCQFSNVKEAIINEEASADGETVVDVYFHNARTIYRDMPLIAARLGLQNTDIQYHSLLLSRYFIHNPADAESPRLLTLYLCILLIVVLSLILIIRNSFELSMSARIHQFGIFSSVGATPTQIRTCLMQEAAVLTILPIILGALLGILLCCGAIRAVNIFAADVAGRHTAFFHYRPYIFALTILISVLTVLFSAWIPAIKLSKITPLEAIQNTGDLVLNKKKHSRVLSALFGIKGELVGNSLKAQRKALRLSSISLLLSFLGFSIMLCFSTLAAISTRYTYFERYQDTWDVMITLKDTNMADFGLTKEVQEIPGSREAVIYQKAKASAILPVDSQSDELAALGGLEVIAGASSTQGQFHISAPIIILDDTSFLRYCLQLGIEPCLDGAIVLNQIWDSADSNFRYKKYVPFMKENEQVTTLYNVLQSEQSTEVPVLSFAQTSPLLREEYENFAIVHFMPLTLWEKVSGQLGNAEADSYIRILSSGNADLADLNRLEERAAALAGGEYSIESENRVQEQLSNDNLIYGMKMILGAFCVLLAIIGISNVFSNTLGFLRQRKREFARYLSIGLTPQDIRKMFCIEAFVIAGKPLLITLPLTVLFVQFAVTASYLDPMVFWSEAPILPILLFAAAIALFVALAYYIGIKRLLQCDLNETLRNDTFN